VLLEGPCGSGKTTLLTHEFPRRLYVTLNASADRCAARRDPAAFLARLRVAAIIDDVHRAPELVAHLAVMPNPPNVLLASSHKLRLPLTTLRLYHPTRAELEGRVPLPIEMLGHFAPAAGAQQPAHARCPWPPDARLSLANEVRDADRFEEFHHVAFQHSGEVLDCEKLAREADVSRTTAVRWLAMLDTCFLTLELEPWPDDFGRRLVRSPKLHFLDSTVFESAMISQIYRNASHSAQAPGLRYWRDSNGMEIPLVVQMPGAEPVPVAIAEMPNPIDEARLRRWMALAGTQSAAIISRRPATQPTGRIVRYSAAEL